MTAHTETDRELSRLIRPVPVLKLLHTEGAPTKPRQWALGSQRLLLGREVDPDAGVQLLSDKKASAVHASIQATVDGVVFEDGKSKNGSFVNGQPVHDARLADGDIIRIGNSLLLFREESLDGGDAPAEARVTHELFVGTSPGVRALRHNLFRAARQEGAVLLLGPTGTGKELAAQALHVLSGRSGPLIRVNSSAITASLAESTLFGHIEGAFTGAKRHTGYFREADTGTLMLDEIGDLPLELQPKLLRALEERAIWPVGARKPEPCQARIIAATNRDLREEVRLGRFRSDLHARLSALPIALPPLRTRSEDILPLFVHKLGMPDRPLTGRLCEALLLYPFPENVRELFNLADYARAFAPTSGALDLPVLAERLTPPPSTAAIEAVAAPATKTSRSPQPLVEREPYTPELLTRLIEEHKGTVSRVASALGVSRRQLGRVLRGFHIDPNHYRRGKG